MKRVFLSACLVLAGFALGLLVGLLPRITGQPSPTSTESPARLIDRHSSNSATEITFSAVIDGTDRFIFTRDTVWNEHLKWGPPQNVVFNSEPWPELTIPPAGWSDLARTLDLTRASIVTRRGRDVITLESTGDGFDLYFADSLPGSAPYEVVISVPYK